MPYASYFPRGINMYVATAEYAIDNDMDNKIETLELGAPVALNTNGILASVVMVVTAAVTVTAFSSTLGTATGIAFNGMVPGTSTSVPSMWGRGLSFANGVTSDRVITVTGYDYLGQKTVENLTFSTTTVQNTKKAFSWLESISFAASSDTSTVNVGWTNVFGLPYTGDTMVAEIKNSAVAANAGTFTAGLVSTTAATATSADSRGTYTPATVLPNSANTFKIMYLKRSGNLHGIAQFAG
jgi:hypothetical protein